MKRRGSSAAPYRAMSSSMSQKTVFQNVPWKRPTVPWIETQEDSSKRGRGGVAGVVDPHICPGVATE
ncbi:hypothetical protein JTE90_028467 [Oedothorax gibbosus]|uniref:Uncharacterized protein n=1 Tax=Oedothorax gibbosus TaxID=931172 RepID=A0AAV6VFA6_9ARAC|nr:hypothetical protein JTE90_028467 [Oedothorax gibbosus]